MDCKITSSIKKRRGGMTLVEMMVAMALGSLVVVALGSLSLYSAKSFRSLTDYSDLNRTSRMALDRMSREIRQSRGLVSTNSTAAIKELVFTSGGTTSNTFAIRYNKSSKTVSMIKGGDPIPLLKDCTDFNFDIYQQTPKDGNFEFIKTSNTNLCKMVEMTWTCSRKVLTATKSDEVKSMQIVIRKKSI